jgi:hypothetical protein
MAAKTVQHLYSAVNKTRREHVVIDMCTLATVEEVKSGKVQLYLPGYVNHHPLHYNTELYAIHLKNILQMMETNPNYHFYPLNPSDFGEYSDDYSPISVVDHRSMMMVTETNVLHFTQPDIIHTLYEHLYSQSRIQAKYSKGREHTMERIRRLLEQMQ